MQRTTDTIAARVRRALAAAAVAACAALVMTWPLASSLGTLGRTQNSGDARYAVWNVAWVAHALASDPSDLYDANIFHPHRNTLAYSEANIGAGVLALPAWLLTRNAHTAFNVVLLAAFAASLVATWLLARRLSGDGWAAAVVAPIFAFCPYLFSHVTHIQLSMAAGLPLSMLALHRLVDAPSPSRGVVLGITLAAQALSCAYYGIFAGLIVGYAAIFYAFTRGLGRSGRYWTAVGIAAAVSVLIVLPFFLPYLRVQEEFQFRRTLDDARMYSAIPRSYLASAAHAHRWMLPLIREWRGEPLFPGFLALAFAGAGMAFALRHPAGPAGAAMVRPRETALLYGSIGVLAFWTSLGPAAGLYTAFYYTIPVFSFLRAPGRTGIVVMLALAVLGVFAIQRVLARAAGWRRAAAAALCAAVLLELNQAPYDWRRAEPLPAPYRVLAGLPRGPVAEFPFYDQRIDFHLHTFYMLRSTAHWQPLVNGYSDNIPGDFRTLATELATFPSRESFRALRERRVRYVTINRHLYGAGPVQDIERRLEAFRQFLRPLAADERTMLFEVVAFPPE